MNTYPDSIKTVVITGPTATGKTALAVDLARSFNGEIVSVDSRQVYKGMDIGSGKDISEYGEIPYHLIDIADPATDTFNLFDFCHAAYKAVADIHARGKLPILCGGTALYLNALLQSYDLPGGKLPERRSGEPRIRQEGTEPTFMAPFKLDALVLGVYFPRKVVRNRIEARLDARFDSGMIEEVKALHDSGVSFEKLEFFGLEYREISRYLQNLSSFDEMRSTLLNRIRQFAKRQDIFFRKMEREGIPIYWLNEAKEPDPRKLITSFLNGEKLPEIGFRLCEHLNAPSFT